MKFFNETHFVSQIDLAARFPKAISRSIRMDEAGESAAILFDEDAVQKDARYGSFNLYDKKHEDLMFYFPFFGEEAFAAKKVFFEATKKKPCGEEPLGEDASDEGFLFLLFGFKNGLSILYATCEPVECIKEADSTSSPVGSVFYMPLKRRLYPCPVCGELTLSSRGDYLICPCCHWEDDGMVDPDEDDFGPNGGSIREARSKYFGRKIKLLEERDEARLARNRAWEKSLGR